MSDTLAAEDATNNANEKVIIKNCAPFIGCIKGIINTQIDNAKDFDVVMPIYNLIEYSDNFWKRHEVYCDAIKTNQL